MQHANEEPHQQEHEIINNIHPNYYNHDTNDNPIVINESTYIYNHIINQVNLDTVGGNVVVVAKKRACKKVKVMAKEKSLRIPKFAEHGEFMQIEHKVSELKEICKHYGIKCSGTKQELKQRIHAHLAQSHFIPRIQRLVRRSFIKTHARMSGPAYHDRSLCVNDTDFYSMEPVRDISHRQFISVRDDLGMVYGFDVMSLYTYFMSETKNGNANPITNPYNRMPLPLSLRLKMFRKIALSHIIGANCVIEVEPEPVLSMQQQDDNTLFATFQQINSHGHYADSAWFSDLNFVQIMRFMRELADIWNYRAQIMPQLKQEICPPHGDPFRYIDLRGLNLQPEMFRHYGIELIHRFVTSGATRDSQSLGAYYVLSALTLVSQPAQIAMPWLYEAVVHVA
jgi:hypothetical protein